MPQIVIRPLITEKTLALANQANIYTFEVGRTAHKDAIQSAIEQLYGVSVVHVRTARIHRAKKRTGRKRLPVLAAARKKAMVQLSQGATISAFDITR